MRLYLFWLLLPAVLISCQRQSQKDSSAQVGSLTVQLKVPEAWQLKTPEYFVRLDRDFCGEKRKDHGVVATPEGAIANAVVWLEGDHVPQWPTKRESIETVLGIDNCEFTSRIVIIPPNGNLTIQSRDPVLHSLRFHSRLNAPVHRVLPPNMDSVNVHFQRPEIIPLSCDLHPWLKAFIVVAAHPRVAVTDQQGTARFSRLRRQKYRVTVWHEVLGEYKPEMTIDLKDRSLRTDIIWEIDPSKIALNHPRNSEMTSSATPSK